MEGAASKAAQKGWPGSRAGSSLGCGEQEERSQGWQDPVFTSNLVFAYWPLCLFLGPGGPVIPEGVWSACQTSVDVLQERPDFS